MGNWMEAFLGHSSKDLKIVNSTYKICQRAKIKPNIAEFEKIEKGKLGAEEIRDMIDRSELFFLFLSENVINEKNYGKTIYTQNWVNFELGIVYAQKKENKKSIYVFESFQQLHFPIPYLDYYILFDPNSDPHWDYVEKLFTEEVDFDRDITKSYNPLVKIFSAIYRLRGYSLQRPSDARGYPRYHRECGAKYTLLSKPEQWLCPKCRKLTNWMP